MGLTNVFRGFPQDFFKSETKCPEQNRTPARLSE